MPSSTQYWQRYSPAPFQVIWVIQQMELSRKRVGERGIPSDEFHDANTISDVTIGTDYGGLRKINEQLTSRKRNKSNRTELT